MSESKLESFIVGDSNAIRTLRKRIVQFARSRAPVLIQGPTGSGKELVAQGLHAASEQSGRLVAVNICAVVDSMFEATLFGHVRGAFTGAIQATAGLLAEADRGTLFLDEIGSLGLKEQAKLLRAIELGVFRPVGASRDVQSSFRIVAATNEDIGELVEAGRFRSDLWYRLRGATLHVPPLRDRREDIPVLIELFLRRAADGKTISPDGVRLLQNHSWPGNVRELRQVVESAASIAEDRVITRRELNEMLGLRSAEMDGSSAPSAERTELLALLRNHAWDTAQVAQELGVHRVTVYRRMRRLGIRGPARAANV